MATKSSRKLLGCGMCRESFVYADDESKLFVRLVRRTKESPRSFLLIGICADCLRKIREAQEEDGA
jgi:hypothetical protein